MMMTMIDGDNVHNRFVHVNYMGILISKIWKIEKYQSKVMEKGEGRNRMRLVVSIKL